MVFLWITMLITVRRISLVHADFVIPCAETRNIIMVPYIGYLKGAYGKILGENYKVNGVVQLLQYLVKSLLENPCFSVYVYSLLKHRLIRQRKETYIQFLETEIQLRTLSYPNYSIFDKLSDVSSRRDKEVYKNTLLVAHFDEQKDEEIENQLILLRKLNEIRNLRGAILFYFVGIRILMVILAYYVQRVKSGCRDITSYLFKERHILSIHISIESTWT